MNTEISRREYDAIHAWINYKYGKANVCESETCQHISTKIEWALKKGCEYKRDRNCFIRLCKRCHIIYDNHKPEKLYSLRDAECMERINKAKFKKVEQYSLEGQFIKLWDSLTEAANVLGLNRNCISNSISKKITYNNYWWKLYSLPSPPKI